MQIDFLNVISIVAVSLWFFSLGYLFFALIAVEHFNYKKNKKTIMENFQPSVTILKPIYGLDPDMLDNLRSFCQQDYPQYQVIFGIQDKNDPAFSIVEEITKEFSKLDVSYIISTERHGTNHKVSNLINMCPYVKHEYILIADSDMRVSKNFLTQVISPFSDTKIGAVTCLYNGIAKDKIASKLNAMFINNWFLPSVLISRILQPMKYCLGATMIVKRNVLKKIGAKIRDCELSKVPLMFIVGEKEQDSNKVSLRRKFKGNLGEVPLKSAIENIINEIRNRKGED